MADTDDPRCQQCVRADLRLAEDFTRWELAAARIAELSAMGTLMNSCRRADGYRVCYRGFPSRLGVLPRYQGQLIDGP